MKIFFGIIVVILCSTQAFSQSAYTASNDDFSAVPVLLSRSSTPLVMLAMSVDHQLFVKAYSDYADNDGDGELNTTYTDTFDYYGYFNSNYCYTQTNQVFHPSVKIDSYPDTSAHQCSGNNDWSGNFLNWATMTRMDIVRKVLYGGKRSTDNALTVLERAHLPMDGHAFSKVFKSNEMSSYTPFNYTNVISMCNLTDNIAGYGDVPIFRIANGDYSRWATSEKWQCNWDGASRAPLSTQISNAEIVRVASCVEGFDADISNRCRGYQNGNIKPVGLLQTYGEDGILNFGLISGSHVQRDKGGLIRKNITKLAGNEQPLDDEINLVDGSFTMNPGIISNLDVLKMVGVQRGGSNYHFNCAAYGISVSSYLSSNPGSSQYCSDWGNPISEIYLETLRFFTGKQANPLFNDVSNPDSDFVAGLTNVDEWVDPYALAEECTQCSIIVLSTGLNSFDSDDLATVVDINGISTEADLSAITNAVGDLQMGDFSAHDYFNGGDNKPACTPSTDLFTDPELSDLQGVCPELPVLRGSYEIAGLAYHAKTQDLRADMPSDQTLTTYALQFADSLPSFNINVDGDIIKLLPACVTPKSPCSLVNVTIISQEENKGEVIFYWEDSLWGGDYDLDVAHTIEYCVGSACGDGTAAKQLKITNTMQSKSTPNISVNYILTGTKDSDGIDEDLWVVGKQNFVSFAGEETNAHRQPLPMIGRY